MCDSTYSLLKYCGFLPILIFWTGKPCSLRHWRKSASRSVESGLSSRNTTLKKYKDFNVGNKTGFVLCKKGKRSLGRQLFPTTNFSKFVKPRKWSNNDEPVKASTSWVINKRRIVVPKNVRSKSANSEWNKGTVSSLKFNEYSMMDMMGSNSRPSSSRGIFPILTEPPPVSALRRRYGTFFAHEPILFLIMAHSSRWSDPK